MLEVRRAAPGDVEEMAALHIAASHQACAGLIPEQALRATTPAERARRWAESLATIGPNEAIIVGVSNAQIAPSISSTQPLQNRRVRLYEVSEVSGSARAGALFAIVKLTNALYDKHFADLCEYSLPRGFDRCVIGEAVARYSSDH